MGSYPIYIERGALSKADEWIPLKGKRICIVTDSGVPQEFVDTVAGQCSDPLVFCFPCGEKNKTLDTLRDLLEKLLVNQFDRKDAIIAIGGGVVTDLAGFASAIYMRGIDFYNIPTTLLSQVDASVGGKTAVDFEGYKNMIGAFWQPKAVIIDPLTLQTLARRRISDGLAEVIKMSLTSDAALFAQLEQLRLAPGDINKPIPLPHAIDQIIADALRIKIHVVEQDERESGLRRILNFGHTLGHAIESCSNLSDRYHGECVALGMLPMCDDEVRIRLIPVLAHCGLPHSLEDLPNYADLMTALAHDKKAAGKSINTVYVPRVGDFLHQKQTPEELIECLVQTTARMRD